MQKHASTQSRLSRYLTSSDDQPSGEKKMPVAAWCLVLTALVAGIVVVASTVGQVQSLASGFVAEPVMSSPNVPVDTDIRSLITRTNDGPATAAVRSGPQAQPVPVPSAPAPQQQQGPVVYSPGVPVPAGGPFPALRDRFRQQG